MYKRQYDYRDMAINHWLLQDETKLRSENNSLVPLLNSSYCPFYLSYQNPDQICYTQSDKFQKGLRKSMDFIRLDHRLLDHLIGAGYIYIYAHYPGQAVRNLRRELFSLTLSEKNAKKLVFVRISSINVLRRRWDAKIACDPDIENEDDRFLNDVMSRIGCIPPYWVALKRQNQEFKSCTTTRQLKEAYNLSRYENVNFILDQHHQPCTEMTISSSVELLQTTDLKLYVQYRTDQYLETRNKKDYSARNLWSSVGGYVGIFLGYSLFQIPGISMTIFYWVKEKMIAKDS